jgi:hypothetical protein
VSFAVCAKGYLAFSLIHCFISFFLLASSNYEILASGFAFKFPWNAWNFVSFDYYVGFLVACFWGRSELEIMMATSVLRGGEMGFLSCFGYFSFCCVGGVGSLAALHRD